MSCPFKYELMFDADFKMRLKILQDEYFAWNSQKFGSSAYEEYKNKRLALEKEYMNQEKRLSSYIIGWIMKYINTKGLYKKTEEK